MHRRGFLGSLIALAGGAKIVPEPANAGRRDIARKRPWRTLLATRTHGDIGYWNVGVESGSVVVFSVKRPGSSTPCLQAAVPPYGYYTWIAASGGRVPVADGLELWAESDEPAKVYWAWQESLCAS